MSRASTHRVREILLWGLSLGLVIGLFTLTGCRKGSSTGATDGGNSLSATGQELLGLAVEEMQPLRLGIDTEPSGPANLLNQWRLAQLETEKKERFGDPLPEESQKLLETALSSEALNRAARDNFDPFDSEHIRTCLLLKSIVDHAARGLDGEMNRASALFDYVVRNIDLVPEDKALQLSLYEVLIFGEGTAADRAWVFAELLRQIKQDAVIVKFSHSQTSPAPWFVGAVVEGELRLFDPLRSQAVPSGSNLDLKNDSKIVPGTLADLANQDVLDALTGKEKPSLSPKDFQSVVVEVVGHSVLWAPRNAKLQEVLTGNNAAVISETLWSPAGDSDSIINRVASLKDATWKREDLKPWSYPESRFEELASRGELEERWNAFRAPHPFQTEGNQTVTGPPTYWQLKTRTRQLTGDYDEAIKGYLRVRMADPRVPSGVEKSIRDRHATAAEDAFFWTGICLMEQGETQPASNQFSDYLTQSETYFRGRHVKQSQFLLNHLKQPGENTETKTKPVTKPIPKTEENSKPAIAEKPPKS